VTSDYRRSLDWWLDLLKNLILRVTTFYSWLLHAHRYPQSRLHCRCMIAAFNSGLYPPSEFPNCSQPQLPASDSSSAQRLNPRAVFSSKSKSMLCYDWRSVGQSVLVWSTHLGPKTRFLLLSHSYGFIHVGCPVWREDWSVVYNCCWPQPAQSYLTPLNASSHFAFWVLIQFLW
jgi:hypothetical protein